ncbi:Fructokinase-2, partial [Thalictrum thalictroides]
WQPHWPNSTAPSFLYGQNIRFQNTVGLRVEAKKNIGQTVVHNVSDDEDASSEEPIKTSKRAPRKSTKKVTVETLDDEARSEMVSNAPQDEGPKKIRRTRKKADPTITSSTETKKKVGRRRKTEKAIDDVKDQESDNNDSNLEWPSMNQTIEEKEEDLEFTQGEDEDISFTYSWPPLVCCFGAAQHAFVPSGRPANRLIDYEIHERMRDALWSPDKFVRAPGSSSSSVAIALASLGGRVAFMGKLGEDDYGQTMLYYLNVNNIQTRSVSIDSKKLTAVSHMRIGKRGGLRTTCVKPCAEDSFLKSEINVDVLKEAKMFYFNSSSLLERDMRSTTLQAIKISKKLGGIIFFDLNLPMPFWQSASETKMFIQEAWNLADVIELTKQELEFLCGIQTSEEFDTKDNDKSKFQHYKREVVMPLWHENLKVLFVTNGTSKIHYYTENNDGSVHGMEDAPITPFTGDMSTSGDGIVAALMRMLTVQPHLITDKNYLEHTIKYAIDCGVIDQWIHGKTCGFPPDEDAEENLVSDPNGIRSITEREYRTLEPVSP